MLVVVVVVVVVAVVAVVAVVDVVGTGIAVIAIEKMTHSDSPTILSKETRKQKTKRTKQKVKEKKRSGMAVHSSSAFSHFHSNTQLPSVSSSGPCSSSSLTRNSLSTCIHRLVAGEWK
jgi:hypothetical protein